MCRGRSDGGRTMILSGILTGLVMSAGLWLALIALVRWLA